MPVMTQAIEASIVTRLQTWDASTNTPTLTSGTPAQNNLYIVNVAGNTALDSVNSWLPGDLAYFDTNINQWTKQSGASAFASTPFIVSADPAQAPYTTIQSAIDAAYAEANVSGFPQIVLIKSGTYTENLILRNNVYLISDSNVDFNVISNVLVIGELTLDPSESVNSSIFSIDIAPTGSSPVLNITSSFSSNILFNNCRLISSFSDAIIGGSDASISFNNSQIFAANSFRAFNVSGYSYISIYNGSLVVSVDQSLLSSFISPGIFSVSNSTIQSAFLFSNDVNLNVEYCEIKPLDSSTPFTFNGPSSQVTIINNLIDSSATPYIITGVPGVTVKESSNNYINSSANDPALTYTNVSFHSGPTSYDNGQSYLSTDLNGANRNLLITNDAALDQDVRTTSSPSFEVATFTSTTDAVRLNELTTAQMNAVPSPTGKILYNPDDNNLYYNNGTSWVSFSSDAVGSLTKYVVGSYFAPYATIQSAINAAVADGASSTNIKVIRVQAGTYTENITVYDGIVIIGNETAAYKGIVFQSGLPNGFLMSTKLVGSVTLDTSAISAATYTAIQNIWISPSSGGAILLNANSSGTFAQAFQIIGCMVDVNQDSQNMITTNYHSVDILDCQFTDNSPSSLGNFALINSTLSPSFISIINSIIQANTNSNALTLPSSAQTTIRVDSSTWFPIIDATLATVFTFRMINSVYADTGYASTLPAITLANVGNVVLNNCSVDMGSTQNFVTCSGTSPTIICDNTSFGLLGFAGGATDIVTGGKTQFTNCATKLSTNVMYLRNDLIVGTGVNVFTGSSNYTLQAALQTTNATPQNLFSVVLNQLESITLKGTITAAQSDHTNAVGGDFTIVARRQSGGNITLIGAPIVNVQSSSAATFSISVDVPTQSIILSVTGTSSTYNWVSTYSYQKVLTNS